LSSEFTLRKNVRNLLEKQLSDLQEAYSSMMNIKGWDNRGYNVNAGIHGRPFGLCYHSQSARWHSEGMRLFLPWHRAYLYVFEQYLKDRASDSNISVPWWDWTSEESIRDGIPKAFAEQSINGNPNPLYSSKIPDEIREDNDPTETYRMPRNPSELRQYSVQIKRMFDNTTDNDISMFQRDFGFIPRRLDLSQFGDFSDELQIIHGMIHVWVGGSMGDVEYAAFDPIFWSHHSMVDRLWWIWQLKYGFDNIPDNTKNVVLEPFGLTVRDVLNIHELGYDYSNTEIIVDDTGVE